MKLSVFILAFSFSCAAQVPAPLVSGGAPQSGYSIQADSYLDFAGTNGNQLLAANLNDPGNACTWSDQNIGGVTTQQTFSTTGAIVLPGAVTTNGVWKDGLRSSTSYLFTPSATGCGTSCAQQWLQCLFT